MRRGSQRIFRLLLWALIPVAATALLVRPERGRTRSSASASPAPVFRTASAFATSAAAASLAGPGGHRTSANPAHREVASNPAPDRYPFENKHDIDAAIAHFLPLAMPTPALSVDAISNFDNIAIYNAAIIPPDVNGDVGPGHYVQAVNSLVRIYDKNGVPITSAFKLSDLFAPLATTCSTRNDGDPIVQYDPLADRWLISQFCTNAPPFRQMIAISKTGDPTLSYYLYEFIMPNVRLNDFPKFGVWPDGYYMSTEEFAGSDYTGMGAFAFDRTKMLAGDPSAAYIYFARMSPTTARLGNLLPSDLDGIRPPDAGMPNVFAGFAATEYGDAQDAIRLFDFHADFAAPLNSTFTERPESPLAVAAFDPTSPAGRADIVQPAPGEMLDSNSDRLNYRAAYRNFGQSESLVLNQTVRLSQEPYRAGVRVYELKRTGANFSVIEQATIGDAAASRWIAAAAQDHQGNLAVGYNHVTDANRPSLRYSGKLAAEPAGTFRTETPLVIGTGVQKAFGWRWGDYGGMNVDPTDDCTFWMTGEYYTLASEEFSDFTWLTRLGKFKFPECTAAPVSAIYGTVTDAATGLPLENVSISRGPFSRSTSADGNYGPMSVLPGDADVTVAKRGYRNAIATVSVPNGASVRRDFSLAPIPVIEAAGHEFSNESCQANGIPEPGETVTISLTLQNNGAVAAQSLTAELLPTVGITGQSGPQNYGTLAAGGASATRSFTFTVSPSVECGSAVSLTFRLSDGQVPVSDLRFDIIAGETKVAFRERFDRVQKGFLPPRWSRNAVDAAGAPDRPRDWSISDKRSQSPFRAAFSPDINQMGLGEMATPAFRISTAAGRLSFRNWYEFETTFLRNRLYDGSLLEIKLDDGPWTEIISAGGVFESGGYDGLIDSCCQNPLRGRSGWSGRSGLNDTAEFITTSVRLPASAAGRLVRLRWLVGTDIGGSREGQYIDDLLVTDGYTCSCIAGK